ncbi:MAG: GIY-YIG nuclease family protein [Candidatus Sedimenticola endophacoides]
MHRSAYRRPGGGDRTGGQHHPEAGHLALTWHLYILRCCDGSLYTGIARDLQRRLHEHNHGARGARYTRSRRPVCLAYSERFESHGEALRREHQVKRMRREQELALIRNPGLG